MQFRLTSNKLVCLLLLHVGAQYSAGAYTSAKAEVQSVDGLKGKDKVKLNFVGRGEHLCTLRYMHDCTTAWRTYDLLVTMF